MARLVRSFRNALAGLAIGFSDHNFRRHLVTTAGVVFCGFYYGLSPIEFSIILVCCAMVMGAELLNTGVERLASGHPNPSPALNVSASAVLVLSIFSLTVGLAIFVPHAYNPWVLVASMILIPTIWMVL